MYFLGSEKGFVGSSADKRLLFLFALGYGDELFEFWCGDDFFFEDWFGLLFYQCFDIGILRFCPFSETVRESREEIVHFCQFLTLKHQHRVGLLEETLFFSLHPSLLSHFFLKGDPGGFRQSGCICRP